MASIYIDFAYEEENKDPKTAHIIMPESLLSLGSKVKTYEANLVFNGMKEKQVEGNLQTIINVFFYCKEDSIKDCQLAAEVMPCVLDRRTRRRSKRVDRSGYYMRLPRICLIRCDSVKFERFTKWQDILEEILKAERNIFTGFVQDDNIFDKFQAASGRGPSHVNGSLPFETDSTCLDRRVTGVKQSRNLLVHQNVIDRSGCDTLPNGDEKLIIGTAMFSDHSSSNCSSNYGDITDNKDTLIGFDDNNNKDQLPSNTKLGGSRSAPEHLSSIMKADSSQSGPAPEHHTGKHDYMGGITQKCP